MNIRWIAAGVIGMAGMAVSGCASLAEVLHPNQQAGQHAQGHQQHAKVHVQVPAELGLTAAQQQ